MKVTIYGERCSGTNYLEELLLNNFDIELTWDYGWKHFFGFENLSNTDDVLFIGIVRNLYDWINSFYREKHHLPVHLTQNINTYLTHPFYSIDQNNNVMLKDTNLETNEIYKNIFELRCVKNRFLIEKMPTLVKNFCLITYDDLTNHFNDTMNKLQNCGLNIKKNIKFPLNVTYYKKTNKPFIKKKQNQNQISNDTINAKIKENSELLHYENILFPNFIKIT